MNNEAFYTPDAPLAILIVTMVVVLLAIAIAKEV